MEDAFWGKYKDQGLKVVALDPDADDAANFPVVQDYVNYLGPPTYPVGIETTANYYAIEAIFDGSNPFPVDIIIDKDGVIQYIAREYDPYSMESVIEELLAQP